jgi:hypothetical protein
MDWYEGEDKQFHWFVEGTLISGCGDFKFLREGVLVVVTNDYHAVYVDGSYREPSQKFTFNPTLTNYPEYNNYAFCLKCLAVNPNRVCVREPSDPCAHYQRPNMFAYRPHLCKGDGHRKCRGCLRYFPDDMHELVKEAVEAFEASQFRKATDCFAVVADFLVEKGSPFAMFDYAVEHQVGEDRCLDIITGLYHPVARAYLEDMKEGKI